MRTFSGFFASSLAIIRLDKLTTLSLRLFPPLKPFERRDQSTDVHEDLVCIAIYPLVCIAPLANEVELGGDGRVLTRTDRVLSYSQYTKSRLYRLNTPPCLLRRSERKGEGRRPGGWRGLLKGSLQSGVANDNRCKFVSNRACEGYCLQYLYCSKGL